MKTLSILGAGIALTSLLVSCNNEDMLQGSKTDKLNTLTAYIEEGPADSRVTIDGEGTFAWETDDKIAVYSADTQQFEDWTYSSYDATTYLTTFTSEATASDEAYAVFPNSLNPQITDDVLQVTLPASYDTNKTAPILTGKCQDGEVGFAHAGGLIRISFENVPSFVDNFVLSTNGQNITGNFTVDKEKAINVDNGENNTVTINFTEEDIKDGSITFDIPVPVGTYKGFKASLRYGENEIYTKSTTEGKTYTIGRRDLFVMPTDEVPTMNYVIEKVKAFTAGPDGTKTLMLGGMNPMDMMPGGEEENMEEQYPDEFFDLTQVKSMYIDKVLQETPIRSYSFSDEGTEEHSVVIIMNDNITTTKRMFANCSTVTSLDLSHLNTKGVTNMNSMFYICHNLAKLDLAGIDTSSVTNMDHMFNECKVLATLDVSKFVTDNVTIMDSMFNGCSSLTSLDVSNFKTDNVTSMGGMFESCSELTSLNLSNFNTEKVTNMNSMFMRCSKLESLDLSNFKTPSLTSLDWIFGYCSSLKTIDLSSFDTSNVTSMMASFYQSGLTSIKMTGALTSLNSYSDAFKGLSSKGAIYYPKAYATEYETMFQSNLTDWDKYLLDENGNVIEDTSVDNSAEE